jgi:hypothetical protein
MDHKGAALPVRPKDFMLHLMILDVWILFTGGTQRFRNRKSFLPQGEKGWRGTGN